MPHKTKSVPLSEIHSHAPAKEHLKQIADEYTALFQRHLSHHAGTEESFDATCRALALSHYWAFTTGSLLGSNFLLTSEPGPVGGDLIDAFVAGLKAAINNIYTQGPTH